jgi:hypothetical protein
MSTKAYGAQSLPSHLAPTLLAAAVCTTSVALTGALPVSNPLSPLLPWNRQEEVVILSR